jgi:hypothetical protein
MAMLAASSREHIAKRAGSGAAQRSARNPPFHAVRVPRMPNGKLS